MTKVRLMETKRGDGGGRAGPGLQALVGLQGAKPPPGAI